MAIERGNVVTVERGHRRRRVPGAALLDGMAVVWKHWQGSFRQNRSFNQIHGTFTVEYPEERVKLPETYRNLPILLYDEETGHELCTSCFQCQRICPPQVIHMSQAKDPATGKAVPALAEFIIEYDACMSCGFCAEICPFDAIKMDHEFELSTADHPGLTVAREELNRPISYYAGIAPTLWAEVRDQALKKLQGNIKRRPDVLGMAPNLAARIAARRQQLAAEAAAAPPPAAPAAAPAAAPGAKLTPEEKAAKLAAIKAANAAKQAGATPAAAAPPEPVAPAPPAEAAPQDEKAARLAAIRARNAARAAASDAPTAEPPPPAAPAAPAPPAENGASAAEAAPQDEKAARLAAIRARNAAKKAAEEGGPPEEG